MREIRTTPDDSFYSTAHGLRLHFLDWGGEGALLLLLAGAGFSPRIFHTLAVQLRSDFRVVGLTRRGHGLSDVPDSRYDLPSLARDIRDFLAHLGCDPVCVVGHSMAGYEIRTLLQDSQERRPAVVLLDAAYPDGYPMPNLGSDPVWSVLKVVPTRADLASPERLIDFYRTNRPDLAANWGEFLDQEIVDRAMVDGRFDPIAAAKCKAHVQTNIAAALENGWPDFVPFRGPLLAIVPNGDRNPLCPIDAPEDLRARADDFYARVTLPWIRSRTAALRRAVPSAEIVELDESNHAVFLPKPQLVARHIRSFVSADPNGLALV